MLIGMILISISIILFICSLYFFKHTHTINEDVKEKNHQLIQQQTTLINEINYHESVLKDKQHSIELEQAQIDNYEKELTKYKKELNEVKNNISKTIDNQKELSQKAFENYCEILENKYKEAENEYAQYTDAMQTAYSTLQIKLMQDADAAREELAKIEATRAAAIQAQLKEKEIEENSTFYCLQITDPELRDIAVLESIKPKLNQPRILSMLIWQTFWRTPMSNLCNNVVGKATKTGIYKITNIKTKECYIGQAVKYRPVKNFSQQLLGVAA